MFGVNYSKLPKHRRYSYTPLYYDEESEELDSRIEQIKRDMGEVATTEDTVKESIRRAYEAKSTDKRYSTTNRKKFYGVKVLLIAGFLGYVFYKALTSNVIETILGNFLK